MQLIVQYSMPSIIYACMGVLTIDFVLADISVIAYPDLFIIV